MLGVLKGKLGTRRLVNTRTIPWNYSCCIKIPEDKNSLQRFNKTEKSSNFGNYIKESDYITGSQSNSQKVRVRR